MLLKTTKILSSLPIAFAGILGIMSPPAQAAYCSSASHYGYGDGYHGQTTANGERFNTYGNTTAHRSLPFGTRLKVTNQSNGKSVIVRVNDRGPYISGRALDLSYGAFSKIASPSQGVVDICYSRV
jgi:rare lipoprotein A